MDNVAAGALMRRLLTAVARGDPPAISLWVAHGLAWVVSVGVAVLIFPDGDFDAAPALATPVVLTGLALLSIRYLDGRRYIRKTLLFLFTVALFGFCLVGSMSVGVLYAPSAIALLLGAILIPVRAKASVGES